MDAAIFVAEKGQLKEGVPLTFIQARPRREAAGKRTRPDEFLPDFHHGAVKWQEAEVSSVLGKEARHALFGSLRVHSLPAEIYQDAHKCAYFEPMPGTLRLLERFNEPVKKLVDHWWPRIETSAKFAANLPALRKYHATLKPGDVTLVGLIAEGGQGLATANNARFLAYLEGTSQSKKLQEKADAWH